MTPTTVAGVYEGSLRVKLGPSFVEFRGEVRLAYDDVGMRCKIEARGLDDSGRSKAVAASVVSVGGFDTTVLRAEGTFSVTGPLEPFANVGGVDVARALLAEFAQNMARLLTSEGLPAPEAEEIPIFEPETVARQVRAVAARAARPTDDGPAGSTPWRGLLGRLRQIVPGRR